MENVQIFYAGIQQCPYHHDLTEIGSFFQMDDSNHLQLLLRKNQILPLIGDASKFVECCDRFLLGIIDDIIHPFLSPYLPNGQMKHLQYKKLTIDDTYICEFNYTENVPVQLMASVLHKSSVFCDYRSLEQVQSLESSTRDDRVAAIAAATATGDLADLGLVI